MTRGGAGKPTGGVTTPYADPLFSVSNMVYDGQNNLTEKTELFNASTLDEDLVYDPLDRLTSHNRGTAPEVKWDYDKAGTRTATNQNGTAETRIVKTVFIFFQHG